MTNRERIKKNNLDLKECILLAGGVVPETGGDEPDIPDVPDVPEPTPTSVWLEYSCDANAYYERQTEEGANNEGAMMFDYGSHYDYKFAESYYFSEEDGFRSSSYIDIVVTEETTAEDLNNLLSGKYLVASNGVTLVVSVNGKYQHNDGEGASFSFTSRIVDWAYVHVTYAQGETFFGEVEVDEGAIPEGELIEGSFAEGYCVIQVNNYYYYYVLKE